MGLSRLGRRLDRSSEGVLGRLPVTLGHLQGTKIRVAQGELGVLVDRLFDLLDRRIQILQTRERVAEQDERPWVPRLFGQRRQRTRPASGYCLATSRSSAGSQLRIDALRH